MCKVVGTVASVELANNAKGELRVVKLTDGQSFPTSFEKHTRLFLEAFVGAKVEIDVSPTGFLFNIARCAPPGEVISWAGLLKREGVNDLIGGMHPFEKREHSVILMSMGPDAKFPDEVRDNGKTLIYCGQEQSAVKGGVLDNNAWFERSACAHRDRGEPARAVRVYEKIEAGKWAYNGLFSLVDCWREANGDFRFRLVVQEPAKPAAKGSSLPWNRVIPPEVKREVWVRDEGRCRACHDDKNLQFDHVIPFSKGGSSLAAANVQILCMACNARKSDAIQ
jgi:hypothetical protein